MFETVIELFTQGQLHLKSLPPLALYIHLPWCIKKCPYCDFNSHLGGTVSGDDLPFSRYVDALLVDLDQQLPAVWGRRLYAVFIGGGTPSLFPAQEIERLLMAVFARLGTPLTGEVTLEANPGSFEQQRFAAYRDAGVTRLSVGVQSFNDQHLQRLGRVHNARQAQAALELAARVFDTFNIDLMYALPEQTVDEALQDIETALAFSPPHLSLYQLTLEPNTQFAQRPPQLPDEDIQHEIESAVLQVAAEKGLQRYEVSAFAKSGHRCQHNLNYWRFGDYLGIGAGAHSKVSFAHQIIREVRLRQPVAYMDAAFVNQAVVERKVLQAKDLPFEFALNGLRLLEGVDLSLYQQWCGRPLSDLTYAITQGVNKALLKSSQNHLQVTPLGLRFLNDVQSLFLVV